MSLLRGRAEDAASAARAPRRRKRSLPLLLRDPPGGGGGGVVFVLDADANLSGGRRKEGVFSSRRGDVDRSREKKFLLTQTQARQPR